MSYRNRSTEVRPTTTHIFYFSRNKKGSPCIFLIIWIFHIFFILLTIELYFLMMFQSLNSQKSKIQLQFLENPKENPLETETSSVLPN